MKRHWFPLAVLIVLAALAAAAVLAVEITALPTGTEKLLAAAIKLVGPAKDTPRKLILKAGDSIVCMGDSITAGGGYLRYMDAFFAQQCGELKIKKVVNKGISGQKAENFIGRFQKDVIDPKPAVVTINVGINDVWHRLRAPHKQEVLDNYRKNVGKMIDQAHAAGIKVILLAPTVIREDPKAAGQKRLPLYVNALRELSVEKKCGFVDLHRMFLDALKHKPADVKGNWLTGDGVHMKPLGYAVMAVGALRGLGADDGKIAATDIPVRPKRAVRK